jgi:hypothetical protein
MLDTDGLELVVAELKQARVNYEKRKEELDRLKEQFDRQHNDLILDVEMLSEQVNRLSEDARKERLTIYDGEDKSAICGVSVKEYKKLVYDEDEALSYAKERLPDAVITKLDTKVFDKIAETGRLDFVEIRMEPRAFVAKELP